MKLEMNDKYLGWVIAALPLFLAALIAVFGGCEILAHKAQTFEPCPMKGPCKILPLGDSITVGMVRVNGKYEYNSGYRGPLFELANNDDFDITFVGTSEPNGPDTVAGLPFPQEHEGSSGFVIHKLDKKPGKFIDVPHIVLLHIGTNNISRGDGIYWVSRDLENLIDNIASAAPNALLVVAQIIPILGKDVQEYNASVEKIVKSKASQGMHIILADQYSGFLTSDLSDKLHPSESGYQKMAEVWYSGIKPYLR